MGAELSPEYWYAKAEETRTIADGMRHQQSKEALIRIAKDYERLAKIAEQMKAQRQKIKL